jgi:hypothetical protein
MPIIRMTGDCTIAGGSSVGAPIVGRAIGPPATAARRSFYASRVALPGKHVGVPYRSAVPSRIDRFTSGRR